MLTDERRVIEYWDRKASDNAHSYHAWYYRDEFWRDKPLCEPDYFWRSKRGRVNDYKHVYRRLVDIREGASVCRRCRQLAKRAAEAVDAD